MDNLNLDEIRKSLLDLSKDAILGTVKYEVITVSVELPVKLVTILERIGSANGKSVADLVSNIVKSSIEEKIFAIRNLTTPPPQQQCESKDSLQGQLEGLQAAFKGAQELGKKLEMMQKTMEDLTKEGENKSESES